MGSVPYPGRGQVGSAPHPSETQVGSAPHTGEAQVGSAAHSGEAQVGSVLYPDKGRWALSHIQVGSVSHPGEVQVGSTPHLGEAQVGLALQQFPQELTCPQVHCISTEFTLRKHGGEKGVPFRVQIDTFRENESGEYTEHLHSASCQIKVFKVPAGPSHLHSPDPVCAGGCWCL